MYWRVQRIRLSDGRLDWGLGLWGWLGGGEEQGDGGLGGGLAQSLGFGQAEEIFRVEPSGGGGGEQTLDMARMYFMIGRVVNIIFCWVWVFLQILLERGGREKWGRVVNRFLNCVWWLEVGNRFFYCMRGMVVGNRFSYYVSGLLERGVTGIIIVKGY